MAPVLLVEDDARARRIPARNPGRRSYRVAEVCSAAGAAADRAAASPAASVPGVILTDGSSSDILREHGASRGRRSR